MKKLLNVAKYLALLAIGVGLFYLAFRSVNFKDIKSQISHIKFGYIIICFFVSLGSHFVRGIRWNMLIRPLGHNVSPKNSFAAVMMGYFANLALPRMGEVSRCVVLNRTDKIPVDKLVGTVITERLIDFISLMLLVLLNFLLEFKKLKDFFLDTLNTLKGKSSGDGSLFSTQNIIYLGIIGVVIIVAGYLTHRRFKHTGLYGRILDVLKGFLTGMKSVLKMKNKWLFFFYTVLMWFLYYLQVYICFFALPTIAGHDNIGALAALTVLVIGSFGFVAPVNGGIGAYHFAVITALSLYGVTKDEGGAAFAIVAHSFQMIVIILAGGLSFLYLTIYFRKPKNEIPSESEKAEVV